MVEGPLDGRLRLGPARLLARRRAVHPGRVGGHRHALCGRPSGHREGEESHQTFIVCSYAPPGNIIGRFRDNVGAPIGG
jgi:hypothetical protein